MAAKGFFLTWGLVLTPFLQAFHLPTLDSPTRSLSQAKSLPSKLPVVPYSDPYDHEVSSSDGELPIENWRGTSPTSQPGTPTSWTPFDFPSVTSPGLETPTDDLVGSYSVHGGDFRLPTIDSSSIPEQLEGMSSITVELNPEQGKDGTERANTAPTVATLPVSSTDQALDLSTSQANSTHPHLQAVPRDVTVTTLSPRPTVSTIPLVTLPADGLHINWVTTEDAEPKGARTAGTIISEQELLGRNQTTVKYLASFRSTQVYGGSQDTEEVSTPPFRPTQAAGYTQHPHGTWKGTTDIASTPQIPLSTSTAKSLDGRARKLPAAPVGSHHPASEEFSPSSSTVLPSGSATWTQAPDASERYTHWGLIIDTTRRPGPWDVAETEQTHSQSSSARPGLSSSADPGTGGGVDVDPQRVRGAVIPMVPVRNVGSSTPGISVAGKVAAPRHPDAAGTHPHGQNSTMPYTPSARLLATPRRGLIRVTTQRALQHPQLARPEPSLPAPLPVSSPPCPRPGSACSQLLPNQTLLRWQDLERTLSFAWALHVYGYGVLFLLLSLLSLACLVGSMVVRVPHLPYVVGASTLLLTFGVLRATFFLVDPYGSRGWLPAHAVRVLYTAPFPLLLSTFAVLLLRLLCQAHLHVLPPRLQSLPLLAMLASLQSVILLAADLFSPPLHPAVAVALHTLSCAAGVSLLPATMFVYWQLRSNTMAEGTPEPGVWSGAWLLLASSGLALPCCGLQLYGVLWLSGLLVQPNIFTWGWWFVQFWFRIGELVLSLTLLFLTWQALCQRCGAADHSCWAKLMRYFCTYRKAEVPEYPNNCYDWTGGVLEKVPNNDISKNLIRNPPGSVRLWALKDSNELRAIVGQGSSPSTARPIYSPKCPNAAAAVMGRSYTSICFERDSVLSLAELEFRPPSPINLSRSIDEALFREHLVRDSIFLRSSLHFPSRFARQDSCSSLHGDCSTLSHTAQPLLARPRRSSDPDCLYSLARASSMGDLTTQSRGLVSEPPTDTSFESYSRTSFSRASLKISWNPWRHGLSSPESLPPEELPTQAQLLPDELPPAPSASAPNSESEARKSFLALSKQVDSRSLSSDTIEL